MSKLVRDKLEGLFKGKTLEATFKKAKKADAPKLLHIKALEESGEWLLAETKDQRLKELADLQEIIWSMGKLDNISPADIMAEAISKQQGRGSFDNLLIMEIDESKLKPKPVEETTTRDYSGWNSYGYSG